MNNYPEIGQLPSDHTPTEQPPFMKVFEGILASQSFELVESFGSEELWHSLLPQEKELLSQLFIIHGERFQNDNEASATILKSFRSACALTPHKARVWFRLGSQLALSDSVDELNESAQALEHSVALDDGFFDAWYTLANVYVRLALKQNDEQYLLKAHVVFEKGSCQFEKTTLTTDIGCPGPFYWHWGLSWFLYARSSGEPCDYQHALTLYKKAYGTGLNRSEFFNDYANACTEFALLTQQPILRDQALYLYEEAVLTDRSNEGQEIGSISERSIHLFNLANCYQHRFEQCFDQGLFDKSHALYEEASELNPTTTSIWFGSGRLHFSAAKFWQDIDLIEIAIEKFEKANSLGMSHPVLMALWAESEVHLASAYDRVDYLASALHRAQDALSDGEDYVECWHALVYTLFEIGRYFSDSSYFDRALVVLEKALNRFPKNTLLWRMLGVLKGALGEISETSKPLQEALLCFQLASQSGMQKQPSFWSDWGVVLVNLAEALQDERLGAEAIEKFERAISMVEQPDPQWLFNCGCTFNLMGQCTDNEEHFERAAQCFDIVFDEESEFIDARLQSGLALFHLGQRTGKKETFAAAASRIEEYLEIEYEDDSAWEDLAIVYLHLIEIEAARAYFQKTEEALEQALALGNERAHYYFACLHSLMGCLPDALEDLKEALTVGALPPPEEIENEAWLSNLKQVAPFQDLLESVRELFDMHAIGEQALDLPLDIDVSPEEDES